MRERPDISDDVLNTRDIEDRIAYLRIGNEGNPQDPVTQWEDEDEQSECAMWLRVKAAVGDDAAFEDGLTLVAADDDGNLPGSYAREHYHSVYETEAVDALDHYVDWDAAAADLQSDYTCVEAEDESGTVRSFLVRYGG